MIWNFFKSMRCWFATSPHFHIRQHGVNGIGDLVDLVDRFIDDRMQYDLEWDDFISWKHDNHFIENFRNAIEIHEPLLFSSNLANRLEYVRKLIEERNRAAALVGLPLREPYHYEPTGTPHIG